MSIPKNGWTAYRKHTERGQPTESDVLTHREARRQAREWWKGGSAVALRRYVDGKKVKEITPKFPST